MVEGFFPTLQQLALATGLGLLVGLERERAGKEAGLRTFSLTALSGTLAIRLGVVFAGIHLGFVAIVVLVLNLRALQRNQGVELTTSTALFVTALAGLMVGNGLLFTPVATIFITLLLLAWKDEMLAFTQALTRSEIHAAITLAILAFVILPVLPDAAIDPWNAVVPRKLWLMVVVVSAIGFANYVLLRLYGNRSVAWTGFLGGLVNSTATVAEMARKTAHHPDMVGDTFRAIMLAKTAMLLRNGVILGLFAPRALVFGLLPVGGMMLVTLSLGLNRLRPTADSGNSSPSTLSSPFSLQGALQFGLMFLVLTLASAVSLHLIGQASFFPVAFLGGLVSSSSSAATAAHLATQGTISLETAAFGAVLTSMASALVLVPIVWVSARSATLNRRMVAVTAVLLLVGTLGMFLNVPFLRLLSPAWS